MTIVRDRYNVPHITGRKRDDVTWAMGWVLQEDRGLLLAQARYAARLAAVDAPNINAFGLVTGLKTYTPTRSVERTIRRNGLRALRSAGRDGKGLRHDIDVFVAGINARLRAEKSKAKPFTRVDLFAFNALGGQIFGEGGGDEARRGQFLGALRARLGNGAAQTLFDDLSEHSDADTPTTLTRSGPLRPRPAQRRAATRSSTPAACSARSPRARARRAKSTHTWASNFLMIGRQRSTTGHPLFVGGPQIGYFYPGLTLEADVRWPGHQARGVYSPAHPGTILIGRGEDFAWSLTSAGSDLIDEYAEILCGGSSTRYRYRGKCRRMGTVDAGTIAGEGRVRYRTTVHGPVTGYATAGGKRVAIARKRASFGRDVLWQLPFRDATIGRISGTRSFVKAFARSPFTFNVGYADDRDIAMFSAGELPRRDPRVDPRLPTLGTGGYEWRGTLPSRKLPQQVNPAGGALLNWNNSPAPGFGAADDNWSYGSLHRVSLLQGQIARRDKHDLASVTSAMNAAATQDLRSTALTPTLSTLLRGGPAPERARPAHARAARGVARAAARAGSTATRTARWTRAARPRSWTRSTRTCTTRCWAARSARSSPTSRRSRARRTGPPASPAAGSTTSTRTCASCSARGSSARSAPASAAAATSPRAGPRSGTRSTPRARSSRRRRANASPDAWTVGRRGRAHQVRPGAAADDDPLHEPPERHPAGHLVQGAPQPPALGTPPDASRSHPG